MSTRVSDTSPGGHSPSEIYIYFLSSDQVQLMKALLISGGVESGVLKSVDLKKNSSVMSHSRTGYCYRKLTLRAVGVVFMQPERAL